MPDTEVRAENPYVVMERDILPLVIEKFLLAGEDYGEVFRDLGLRGQYSDIHRKVAKLKKVLWDGEVLNREDAEDILGDLVGNCLIALYLIRERQHASGYTAAMEFTDDVAAIIGAAEGMRGQCPSSFDASEEVAGLKLFCTKPVGHAGRHNGTYLGGSEGKTIFIWHEEIEIGACADEAVPAR